MYMKKERNIFMTKPGDSPTNNWEEKYEKEHKLRQEVEGELSIVKQQYLEVMIDNKNLARQVEDKLNQLRKSGL